MKTILAPVDFSDATESVATEAAALARGLGARVVLEHVLVPPRNGYEMLPDVDRLIEKEQPAAEKTLSHWRELMNMEGVQAESVVRRGDAGLSILDEAKRLESAYIVLGSHGHGALYQLLMGGTATEVIRKARCPVVVVPPHRKD